MAMQATLAEDLETSTAAVVANPVAVKSNRYRVVRVLRGRLGTDRVILSASAKDLNPVILTTFASEGSPMWSGQPHPADDRVLAFTEGLLRLPPRAKDVDQQRMDYFLPYLNDRSRVLADCAYAEFAAVPYVDLAATSKSVGNGRLRQWLENRATPDEYRSLYYVMLGQAGSPSDMRWLEPEVRKASTRTPLGYEPALLFAYLQLGGEAALGKVESAFLARDSAHRSMLLEAMRVMVSERGRIPRAKLLPAFHRTLSDLNLAPGVLQNLAAWADWSCCHQVVGLLNAPDRYAYVRITALQYLLSCPAPEARQKVASLRKSPPAWLRDWPQPFRVNPPR